MRTIVLERSAAQELDRLPPDIRRQIEGDLHMLAISPERVAAQVTALQGIAALRLRSGVYRIIYVLEGARIRVLGVGHRRDVYR